MPDRQRRSSLAVRLLVVYAVTFLGVLAILGFLVERSARNALLDEVESGLVQQARMIADLIPVAAEEVQPWVDVVGGDILARVTVVAADGVVQGDSVGDPRVMENHAGRPEIDAALAGAVGRDRRVSASTGIAEVYVAVPAPAGKVIRLSLPEETVAARLADLRSDLLWVVALAGALGVVVVASVARILARPLAGLANASAAIARGQLDAEVPRSSVDELDRLGRSIASMAAELGSRLTEVDAERQTLQIVLDALPQGTLLVGEDDEIAYANPTFAEMVGLVPSSLGRLSPFRIQELVRRARSENTVESDIEYGRPPRILNLVAVSLGDPRVLVVITDVTERRRITDMRRDFVTNASHELKTPVSAILAAAETIQIAAERAPERVPEFAAQIERSARSLSQLVSDLLDLSRLEGKAMDVATVDFSSVVKAEAGRMRPLAESAGINLRSHVEESLAVLGSDADLAVAVRNLLDNAIRYTEHGGEVTVSVRSSGDRALLTVEDSGAGIPRRDLARVFERFYRVDEARSRATGGTGLGLAIVRHIAEMHGGEVRVDSELGVGSTFTMTIPLSGDVPAPSGPA